jgi:hypothetical protein
MTTTLFVKHTVKDYDTWKTAYDAHGSQRKEYGASSASVHRDSNDPNTIVVTVRFPNAQAAMAFANSDDLKSAMSNAGVISQPELWFADDIEQTAY